MVVFEVIGRLRYALLKYQRPLRSIRSALLAILLPSYMTCLYDISELKPKKSDISMALRRAGGQGGIRTHGELPPTTVFKTVALNHSATCPLTKRPLASALWDGKRR